MHRIWIRIRLVYCLLWFDVLWFYVLINNNSKQLVAIQLWSGLGYIRIRWRSGSGRILKYGIRCIPTMVAWVLLWEQLLSSFSCLLKLLWLKHLLTFVCVCVLWCDCSLNGISRARWCTSPHQVGAITRPFSSKITKMLNVLLNVDEMRYLHVQFS